MALDKLNHNYEDPLIVSNLLVNGKSNGTGGTGGGAPAGGTTGQVLTKNSGKDYDASWATLDISATTVSATPPTDPAPQSGDGWYNSVDGTLYIYYVDSDSGQWVQATSAISSADTNPIPAGSIMAWTSTTAPSNWLLCDGSAIQRASYPSLFAAIGTTYGVGDGATTFNLPNLKARTITGLDASQTDFDTIGKTGGSKTTNKVGTGSATGYGTTYSSTATSASTTSTADNMPPYITLTYIIKASAGVTPGDSALATRVGVIEVNSVAPIKLNGQTLSASYTIPAGYNGLSAGPITIANGVTVTVPDGSAWSIV